MKLESENQYPVQILNFRYLRHFVKIPYIYTARFCSDRLIIVKRFLALALSEH